MAPEQLALIICFAIFAILIIIGTPIAFSAAIAGIAGIILLQGIGGAYYILGSFTTSRVNTFDWTAIPLFILMGSITGASGIGKRAFTLALKWLGGLRGSLLLVVIMACGLIGATTGSGATGTIIMGKLAMPEMRKYKYNEQISLGAIAASGTFGVMIPPSGSFLLVGILTYMSISKLFMCGILPGILSIFLYMSMVSIRCYFNPALAPKPEGLHFSWGDKISSLFKEGWGIAVLFLGVMIPLFAGLATATEVAAIGCIWAVVLWYLAYRRKETSFNTLTSSLVDSVKVSSMIFAFVIGTGILSQFLVLSGIVPDITSYLSNLDISPRIVLFLVMLVFIPLGMFLDPTSLLLLTVPIIYPIFVNSFGFDGYWIAVMVVLMVELAVVTPPVGLSLFVATAAVPKAKLNDVTKGVLPFAATDFVRFCILFAFPSISLFLPNLFGLK